MVCATCIGASGTTLDKAQRGLQNAAWVPTMGTFDQSYKKDSTQFLLQDRSTPISAGEMLRLPSLMNGNGLRVQFDGRLAQQSQACPESNWLGIHLGSGCCLNPGAFNVYV